jgi:hypothetical protein
MYTLVTANRRGVALLALVTAILGCHDGTGPSLPLPTSLSVTGASPPLADPSLVSAGDSVVAAFVSSVSGCDGHDAYAVRVSGVMSIVVTAKQLQGVYCPAVLQYATYRVVVHDAPPGGYPVIVSMRWLTYDGKTESTREIARGVIALP